MVFIVPPVLLPTVSMTVHVDLAGDGGGDRRVRRFQQEAERCR